MPFDIVLVDDHKLVRDGVRTILERGTEFHVVGEAENGGDAVALCKKSLPDIVLMDIGLPGMNGIEATTELLRVVSYHSSQVSDRLLHRIQRGDLETHDLSPLESLSPRELQVLRLVAEGKTSKDIAVLLDLGLQTVRSYRKTMMKKLGVNNVAGLTQLALAAGITHWNKPDANTMG